MINDQYQGLETFAATDLQREVARALPENKTASQTARVLGVDGGTVRRIARTLLARKASAARKGYQPERDANHQVPDGQYLKGVSTLYKNGEPVLQWVKSNADQDRMEEIMRAACESMKESLDPLPEIDPPLDSDADLCNFYPIADAHIGMLSWPDETGAVWDMAVKLMRRCVEAALEKHAEVDLVILEGNHDPSSSLWLQSMFSHLYSESKHLRVSRTISPYWSTTHGETMIGGTHGHLKGARQPDSLALLFADSPNWGKTSHRYIHCGHLHNRKVAEVTGCIIEQHTTLAAPDAYAHRGGWRSKRGMRAITYHKQHGEVAGVGISPEMI